MKLLIKILIVAVIFYLSYSILARGQATGANGTNGSNPISANSPKGSNAEENPINLKEYEGSKMEEEDFYSYDEDFFTRKVLQRNLAPLTHKERITWSFRMAETNAFL
jgi:hypothetical protein